MSAHAVLIHPSLEFSARTERALALACAYARSGLRTTIVTSAGSRGRAFERAAQAEARLAEELAAAELDTREKFRSILIESLRMLDTETSNEAVTSLDDFLSILAGKIEEYLPDAPDLEASLRMRIGVGQTRESKFESAEYNLRRALAGWIEATDAESPETAAAKHNLARMYWKSGDYASAEPLYRAALVTRRSLGEDAALDAARTAQHLASTLQRLGRFDEAVPLFEESLATRRRLLGFDDPAVANTLNSLGACYMQERMFEEAMTRYREARRIVALNADPDDWRLAAVAMNEARCLMRLDRLEEARELLIPSIESAMHTWPEDDPRVLRARFSLARIDDDAPLAQSIAEMLSDRLGPGHDDVAGAWVALAELHLESERWEESLTASVRARRDEASLTDMGVVGHALLLEAEALEAMGKQEEAVPIRRRATEILSRELRPEDPLIMRARRG